MMRFSPFLATAFLPLPVLGPAQLWGATSQFGVQATLAIPTDDLRTNTEHSPRFGSKLGMHVLADFENGQALRPRLDYGQFPGGVSGTHRLTQTSLGVDYLYFMDGTASKGLYAVGGLGFAFNTYTPVASVGNKVTSDDSTFSLGLGYQFSHRWGLEGGYSFSRFSSQDRLNGSLNGFTVSATCRF